MLRLKVTMLQFFSSFRSYFHCLNRKCLCSTAFFVFLISLLHHQCLLDGFAAANLFAKLILIIILIFCHNNYQQQHPLVLLKLPALLESSAFILYFTPCLINTWSLVPQQIGRGVALLLIKMPRRWYFRVAPCQSIIFHWPPSSFPEPTTPQGNICQLSHQEFVQFVPELAISSNLSLPIWAFLFIKKLIVNKFSLSESTWEAQTISSRWSGLLQRGNFFCKFSGLSRQAKLMQKAWKGCFCVIKMGQPSSLRSDS